MSTETKQRELKFRVWNGAEMVYDVTVGKFGVFYVNPGDKGNGLDPNDSASITPFTTKYHEGTPVMQFANDKYTDGGEVFEGDIYEYEYEYDSDYDGDMPIVKTSKGRGTVKSIYDTWQIQQAKKEGGKVVCVGHIYSSPSSIEESKAPITEFK